MVRNILFLFISIVLVSSANLQGKVFTIVTFDEFENIDELKFVNDYGMNRIVLEKYFVNNSYSIPKHNSLSFFAYNSSTKETSIRPVLEIDFSNGIKNNLVLLEKAKDNNEIKYTFLDTDLHFPTLSTLIFNRTKIPAVAKIGNEFFKIAPFSMRNIRFKLSNKRFFKENISFAVQHPDKSIEYIYSSFWKLYKHQKKVCFISYNEGDNKLEFRDFIMN